MVSVTKSSNVCSVKRVSAVEPANSVLMVLYVKNTSFSILTWYPAILQIFVVFRKAKEWIVNASKKRCSEVCTLALNPLRY